MRRTCNEQGKWREGSCKSVLGVSMLPLSSIFLLDFGTVLAVWFFLFLILIFNYVLLSEVPITTAAVNSNLDQGEMYNIMW